MLDQVSTSQFDDYTEDANQLLQALEKSPIRFEDMISAGQSTYDYYNVPVLMSVPIESFLLIFYKLSNRHKKSLGWALERRYKYPEFNRNLKKELNWLKDLLNVVEQRNLYNKGTISGYTIESGFLKSLKLAIESLEASNVVSTD